MEGVGEESRRWIAIGLKSGVRGMGLVSVSGFEGVVMSG